MEEKLDALEYIVNEDDEVLSEEENVKKKATTELRNIILSIMNYNDDEEDLQNIIDTLTRTTTAVFKQYSKENDFKTRNEVIKKSFTDAGKIYILNKEMKQNLNKYDEIIEQLNEMEGKKLHGGLKNKYNRLLKESNELLDAINRNKNEIDNI